MRVHQRWLLALCLGSACRTETTVAPVDHAPDTDVTMRPNLDAEPSGPSITPRVYRPTRIGVTSLSDVVVDLPEDGEVARNDTYGMGTTLTLVAPDETLTLETKTAASATVRVLEPPSSQSLARGVPRTVRLTADPDRGHFADLTFTLDRATVLKISWSAVHESPDHRGEHHPALSVYGPRGPVGDFRQSSTSRSCHLPAGDYRIRIEAEDDEWLSYCDREPMTEGCDTPPDATRDYDVRVQWDFTEKPGWVEQALPEPKPHDPPAIVLAPGVHELEVEPYPPYARLPVHVPKGHDLFVASNSPVSIFYETRRGGEMRSSGGCEDNRCVLTRVEDDEVFIEADHVTAPTTVPLDIRVLPPRESSHELRVGEIAEIELGATRDPRGPMAAVTLIFEEAGTFLLTAKVPYGPIAPRAELELFSPFGDEGAHNTFANLFVEREIDGTRLMTTPEYAAMFIEVGTPGKHLVRVDGTGRAPQRTIELELVHYR